MNAPAANLAAETALDVRVMAPEEADACDTYVRDHADGKFFHLSGWADAARRAYGYRTLSLVARRGAEIVGLLPLVDVRAPLLGRSLVSTAFTVDGGPVANNDVVINALADKAAALGAENNANYIELRANPALGADWLKKTGVYAGFELPLPVDEAETLAMIPRKRRAEVRKAIKAAEAGDLKVQITNDLDALYRLYAVALRNHGTPVFPKKFLHALAESFSEEIEISIAEYGGAPVAALLSFYFKDTVLPYYIGALPEARSARAAEYLYWSLMRRAAEKGVTRFDFGRSKIDSGPYHFKKLWGAEPHPITYRCKLVCAKSLPDVNPNNPKFSRFVVLWRRLPMPVANRVGPLLAANFP